MRRHLLAACIGSPEAEFPKDYPIKSPSVRCVTTNNGKTRFNPNIYAEGKVCLSILGTWRGNPGEEWSSAQGLESVLLSIQSLMSSNPYENEPGYETAKKEERKPQEYVAKIRHETLRVSVVQRLESLLQIQPDRAEPALKKVKTSAGLDLSEPDSSIGSQDGSSTPATDASAHEYDAEATFNALDLAQWDPFADLTKRRFLWYYDAYLHAIDKFKGEQRDGTAFTRMEFEYPPNSMEGHFGYQGLRTRIEAIYKKLEEEKSMWEQQGAVQVEEGTQLATQLAFQFTQQQRIWSEDQYSGSRIELSLPNKRNPFVWDITLFGEPMTK